MTLDLITFTEIAGATVYYPPNGLKPRKVRLNRGFHAVLGACLKDLWQRCPWGRAEWLGSLGCYVASTPDHDTGRHDIGEAVDISSLRWPTASVERGSAEPYPAIPREIEIAATDPGPKTGRGCARYLAVAAVFRLHFQTALDWWHPDGDGKFRHRDHWHIDAGRGAPTWEARKNQVRFLQAALRYVWGAEGLAIDGKLGAKTQAAIDERVDTRHVAWPQFLEETARRGFGREEG